MGNVERQARERAGHVSPMDVARLSAEGALKVREHVLVLQHDLISAQRNLAGRLLVNRIAGEIALKSPEITFRRRQKHTLRSRSLLRVSNRRL